MPIFKDKEVTIMSKDEATWTKVKEATEQRIKNTEEALLVDRAFLEMCQAKLKNEKRN